MQQTTKSSNTKVTAGRGGERGTVHSDIGDSHFGIDKLVRKTILQSGCPKGQKTIHALSPFFVCPTTTFRREEKNIRIHHAFFLRHFVMLPFINWFREEWVLRTGERCVGQICEWLRLGWTEGRERCNEGIRMESANGWDKVRVRVNVWESKNTVREKRK